MSAPVLYLVRHTEVALEDGVPPHRWLPTAAGLEAARRLAAAPLWRDVDLIATSPERKAVATAEPIAQAAGLDLRVEPDLREVERAVSFLDAEAHRDHVSRYLRGEPIEGWEPKAQAHERFQICATRLVAAASGPVAVVSHATVMALDLGLTPEEWVAIPLPAVAVADPASRRLLWPFVGVDELAERTGG
jgi:broad specificity phosphatase PhoE